MFLRTVSEARSYDETTIQPLTKTMRSIFDSKPPSHHHNNDVRTANNNNILIILQTNYYIIIQEANTMAERDLGSTFLLPHTHLYKPDRVSLINIYQNYSSTN